MPQIVDDAFGRIRQVLLTIPDYAVVEFAPAVESVLKALPATANLDILVGDKARDVIQPWLVGRQNVRKHLAPPELDFSHWAQDAIAGVLGEHGPALLISDSFDRHDDAEAGQRLAEAAGLSLIRSAQPYDGGNVLTMGDVVLAGGDMGDPTGLDTRRRIVTLATQNRREVEQTVASTLLPSGWREVRRLGAVDGSYQPLFHIDLFVAPAGVTDSQQPRWIVGCPRLGASLMGVDLLEHADAALFDDIADALRRSGAEVLRSPQPLIWTDRPDLKLRTWFHLPVNNVLVEIVGGRADVWLPCFESAQWSELRTVDDANTALWQQLGFTVHRVGGCLPLAERRGALRCMCNVVARDRGAC